jgi:hypothetical protein
MSVHATGLYTVSHYRSNSDLSLHVSIIVKMLYYSEVTHTVTHICKHTLTRMCLLNNQFPYPFHMMLNSLSLVVPWGFGQNTGVLSHFNGLAVIKSEFIFVGESINVMRRQWYIATGATVVTLVFLYRRQSNNKMCNLEKKWNVGNNNESSFKR